MLYSNLEEFDRMAKMIGDMLYLAQADHRLSQPEKTTVDLAAEVHALFDYFEAWAEEAGIELALEGESRPILGNQSMLRRAMSNLISNAIRFTSRGQVLTVKLVDKADAVELVVENPGAEIAAAHLPRLFDRFYRFDPARQHKGDGAGLGLAIVKAIVDMHGGTVHASSAAGWTRFIVRLPAASSQ